MGIFEPDLAQEEIMNIKHEQLSVKQAIKNIGGTSVKKEVVKHELAEERIKELLDPKTNHTPDKVNKLCMRGIKKLNTVRKSLTIE